MDYNTLVIILNEKSIVKINGCKELAHGMDHSRSKPSSTETNLLFEYSGSLALSCSL